MKGKLSLPGKEEIGMDFRITLAGVEIAVESLYDEVYRMCIPYLSDSAEEPAFRVRSTEQAIGYERRKADEEARLEGREPVDYGAPYLETLAVYRRIAAGMLDHRAVLMHGSAVGLDGNAWMFTAPSGVGKTTHTRLWLKHVPGSFVVNGDKPLIRLTEDAALVCGTPWSGKEGWNTNTAVPLKGIVFLERGEKNVMEPVEFSSVFPRLLQQTYRPRDPAALRNTMSLVRELSERVRFYRLRCNMEPEAALVALEGLRREETAGGAAD